jgi:hypothetical protein
MRSAAFHLYGWQGLRLLLGISLPSKWNGCLSASRDEIRQRTISAHGIAQVSSYSMWHASQSAARRNRSLFAILFPVVIQVISGEVRGKFPAREV